MTMTWRSCLAHKTVTGHGAFYRSDPLSDRWSCTDCQPVPTCQFPTSHDTLCSCACEPGTPFCPAHQPQLHLQFRGTK